MDVKTANEVQSLREKDRREHITLFASLALIGLLSKANFEHCDPNNQSSFYAEYTKISKQAINIGDTMSRELEWFFNNQNE